jgi:hypothetical protein
VTVPTERDAYGAMMLAVLGGEANILEIVERDDDFIDPSAVAPKLYFAPFRRWPTHQQ